MLGSGKGVPFQLNAQEPVVVMGRGHSGTRILAWALVALGLRMGAKPDKYTGDAQDRRFTGTIKKLAQRTLHLPGTAAPSNRDLKLFQQAVKRYIRWLGELSPAWGWKFPETYLIGNIVDAVFPRARYIHMIRDGRDLAFKFHLTDDPTRDLGAKLLKHLDAMDRANHIQAALSWEFQLKRFENLAARLENRVHTITFEAFCLDPVREMEKTADFLNVPMTNVCRDYLVREVDPAKVAQFQKQDPLKVAEVENLIGQTLVRYGYR
jgi:hypothetical protein